MRYQLILLPCPETERSYWHKVVEAADKIKDLRPQVFTSFGQLWHVRDVKNDRIISSDEFWKIVTS